MRDRDTQSCLELSPLREARRDQGVPTAKEISPKGMILLLLMFVVFPIVLFLIHIFVPGM